MGEEGLKHKTKKGLFWSFFNQFATYSMQFVVGIVMARLLTPSDYGITAIPAIFMAIASVFIESGFSSALVRKQDLTEKDLSTAFYYSISIGCLMYIILFFSAPIIAKFYHEPVLTPLVRITALSFLWSPLNTPQNVILKRNLDFKLITKISIVKNFIAGVVGILTAYLGYGLWALVISGLVSSFLGFILMLLAVRWVPKEKWNKESFNYLWGYGNKLVITSLINTLYANVGPIILGRFGTADLGNYNRAKGYAALPSSNVAGVLTQVTFPVLSKLQNDDEALAFNYRKMIRVSAYVVFPIMLMLAALARPLVLVLITEKWESSILLLQILCFVFMWQPIQVLNLNVLLVKGRSDLSLRIELIKKPVSLTIVLIGLIKFGVIGFCIADFISSMFALIINTYYTGEILNVGYFKQMKDIFPTLCISLIMFLSVILIISLFDNLIVQILVGGIVGLTLYLSLSLLFKFEELNEVKYLLSTKR